MHNSFITIIEEILDIPEGSLNGKTPYKTLPEWDSLAALGIMVAIEDHFKKVVDPSIFKDCNTVEELLNKIIDA